MNLCHLKYESTCVERYLEKYWMWNLVKCSKTLIMKNACEKLFCLINIRDYDSNIESKFFPKMRWGYQSIYINILVVLIPINFDHVAEAHSESCQTFKMELFTKIVFGWTVIYFHTKLHRRCLSGYWTYLCRIGCYFIFTLHLLLSH